jgi:hypothetical protein
VRDLGIPLLFLARDLGAPVKVRVVELLDLLHALHEARELLELRPLVEGRAHRHVDLDRLRRRGHACGSPCEAATALSHLVAQQQASGGQCRHCKQSVHLVLSFPRPRRD